MYIYEDAHTDLSGRGMFWRRKMLIGVLEIFLITLHFLDTM